MQVDLVSVHPCIGDDSAGRHQILTKLEGRGHANSFYGRINTPPLDSCMTASAALPLALLIACVAPKRIATSSRLWSRSIMTMSADE